VTRFSFRLERVLELRRYDETLAEARLGEKSAVCSRLGLSLEANARATLEAARERIKRYAAPVNARRMGYKTPCAMTGKCTDCDSPQRICNAWSIIEGQIVPGRIHVKFVGEDLGY